jgi:hypothetical protein
MKEVIKKIQCARPGAMWEGSIVKARGFTGGE